MKKLMLMLTLLFATATTALANNCGYPARTKLAVENFQLYAAAYPTSPQLEADLANLKTQIDEDLVQISAFRANFTEEERTAFFKDAEHRVHKRINLLETAAATATKLGMPPEATAWLTTNATALSTCGESKIRKQNGSNLPLLVNIAQPYKNDAIIASLLESLPQTCNDTLLNTAADTDLNPMSIPDAGTPAAYQACADLLVKTADRSNPAHFGTHHMLADPACELATRLIALHSGAVWVTKRKPTDL